MSMGRNKIETYFDRTANEKRIDERMMVKRFFCFVRYLELSAKKKLDVVRAIARAS